MKPSGNQFFLKFVITAYHIMVSLASELYRDAGQCLWELVRNGVVASMPNGKWMPGVGNIEITLMNSHPLNPKAPTLVILDRGIGFTEQSLQQFCTIGPTIRDKENEKVHGTHGGAAQKRIGRFAAFALNKRCFAGDVDSGYYILTRTSQSGQVRYIEMIPSGIEKNQGPVCSFIAPDSTEMGPQKNITGSFTAIVIPNPVFESADEIRDALRWYIPRRPAQMFSLTVNGKRLDPPELASKIAIEGANGNVSIYVDKLPDDEQGDGGIWLTDEATGLRVAQATRLSQHLPYPMWRTDLQGDCFIADLLPNQDSSRTSLNPRFLRSAAWRQLVAYLNLHVVKDLRTLLGDTDSFHRTGFDRAIMDFVEQARGVYGPPDAVSAIPGWPTGGVRGKPPTGGTASPPVHVDGIHGGTGGPRKDRPERPRVMPVKIGDKTYSLAKRVLEERCYAQVQDGSSIILINTGRYSAMPKTAMAQAEHVMLMVLSAVANTIHGDNHDEAMKWVAERRAEFLAKRSSK